MILQHRRIPRSRQRVKTQMPRSLTRTRAQPSLWTERSRIICIVLSSKLLYRADAGEERHSVVLFVRLSVSGGDPGTRTWIVGELDVSGTTYCTSDVRKVRFASKRSVRRLTPEVGRQPAKELGFASLRQCRHTKLNHLDSLSQEQKHCRKPSLNTKATQQMTEEKSYLAEEDSAHGINCSFIGAMKRARHDHGYPTYPSGMLCQERAAGILTGQAAVR